MSGSEVLDDLLERGLVHDSTDRGELRVRLDEGPVAVYAGFDPTSDSLQVGNLVPLILLRRFQLHGHRPIALAGGATGMIGDPSGKSDERNLLDDEALTQNLAAVKSQLERLLDFEGGANPALLVDNRDWTASMSYLDFLRDVGKHMTVQQMLAKESVKNRVASASGISYAEFSYMLLQAFDFRHLNLHMGCELQVGGSDQWGNITAGIDLVRKTTGVAVHGLTVPLLTDNSGHKLGKTAAGAIYLSRDRTPVDTFYQYFVNLGDSEVERVLLQLTLLPVEEIRQVMAQHEVAPEKRLAQRTLARAMTELVHGAEAADRADAASRLFTATTSGLSMSDLDALSLEIPTSHLDRLRLADGIDLVDLLAETGITQSKGEARRLLSQAGISVNDETQTGTRRIDEEDLLHGAYLLIRRGKRNRHLIAVHQETP